MQNRYLVIALVSADPDERPYMGCKIVHEDAIFPMIYRVVHGPSAYMDCFEFIGFNCARPVPWWEEDRRIAEEKNAQIIESLRQKTAIKLVTYAYGQRTVDLASIDGVPEFKTEWEGSPIPYPVLYTRRSRLVAYAEFSAPDDLLNQFWGDISRCAVAAGAAAGLAAILGSPAAALPAFKAAFIGCVSAAVGDRVNEISVSLNTRQESGEWSRV